MAYAMTRATQRYNIKPVFTVVAVVMQNLSSLNSTVCANARRRRSHFLTLNCTIYSIFSVYLRSVCALTLSDSFFPMRQPVSSFVLFDYGWVVFGSSAHASLCAIFADIEMTISHLRMSVKSGEWFTLSAVPTIFHALKWH